MLLHEGTLLRRTLIQFNEGSGAAIRTLLDLQSWLGQLSAEELNRIVLYISVRPDSNSDVNGSDTFWLYVKTYGMALTKVYPSLMNNAALIVQEQEFPLATINTPSGGGNVLIQGRFANWLATETHSVLIEIQAYLLDKGPGEMLVRTF